MTKWEVFVHLNLCQAHSTLVFCTAGIQDFGILEPYNGLTNLPLLHYLHTTYWHFIKPSLQLWQPQNRNIQLIGWSLPVSGSFLCQHHLRNMCACYGRAFTSQISIKVKFLRRVHQQRPHKQSDSSSWLPLSSIWWLSGHTKPPPGCAGFCLHDQPTWGHPHSVWWTLSANLRDDAERHRSSEPCLQASSAQQIQSAHLRHHSRISKSQSLDSSLLRFVLTCANHPYEATMANRQAISRPSTSSQRCYHLHLADRPTWLPGRHGTQRRKLHWLHEYGERWPVQPVPCHLFALKFWHFNITNITKNTFIKRNNKSPILHILPSILQDTSELSPPKAGSPHVTTLSSDLMAAKAPSLGTTCWTSTSSKGLWLRRPPHVTTVPSSLMAVKAASVATICRTPLLSLALKSDSKNQETFKQPQNKISPWRRNRMKHSGMTMSVTAVSLAASSSSKASQNLRLQGLLQSNNG